MEQLHHSVLRAACDPAMLRFRSTADLPPPDGMIGQERAVAATAFGIAMRRPGYNLFVLGPPRAGKATTMRRVLERRAAEEPTPSDWCYVHSFADPYRPVALELPPGRGRELRAEMARLVDECQTRLPRAFESEQFERHKARIRDDVGVHQREAIEQLEARARAEELAVVRTPQGLTLAPAPHGEPLGPDEFAALNEKIEGFFDVCRARGLTGGEGVVIPEGNVRHLMLRADVVDAVREGKFQVHAIGNVDEGLTLLSGRVAGELRRDGCYPEGTFNAAVERALEGNVARLKELR